MIGVKCLARSRAENHQMSPLAASDHRYKDGSHQRRDRTFARPDEYLPQKSPSRTTAPWSWLGVRVGFRVSVSVRIKDQGHLPLVRAGARVGLVKTELVFRVRVSVRIRD